jgi:hypothetical protein
VHRREASRHAADSQALACHGVDVRSASPARARTDLHRAAHGIGLAPHLTVCGAGPGAIEVDMPTTVACANAPEIAVKTLACAVIKQALADALDPTTPSDVRRDAEQFLAGDAWFRRWCVAAGIRPIRMISGRHAA